MLVVRAFLMGAVLWLSAGYASALQVTLTPADPIMTVEFPSSWQVSDIKRGIQAKTADEEVYLWFEVYAPVSYKAVVREHEKYFEDQGVKITGEGKVATHKEGDVTVKITDFPATWQGKPTVLRYLAFDLGLASGKQLLMSYWASPEGDKKYDAAMNKILESLKAAK